jgi:DNA invertase Pin-like site-specific DNA recombinase
MQTTTPQVRAGCYLRISSDPNDKRAGVDRQREDTALMAEIQGWSVAGFYQDNDRSASNGGPREHWERLLADVAAGKIGAIVVWNQDRGWRKMADLESLRPQLEPRGVLLATTNIGVIDFRNADDVFRAQVSTAMSEMEIAKMKVRMRRAGVQRADRGIPKWRTAFGYDVGDCRADCADGCNGYHLDPVTAPLVDEAYRSILAGASLNDICRLFNDAGAHGLNGKPWTASTVSLFLRAPRNAGLRSYDGQIVGKGTWPALVNEKTWRSVQAKISAPSRKPGKKSVQRHLLTAVLMCGNPLSKKTGEPCGGYLSGYKTAKGAHAYSCKSCRGVAVRAAEVEDELYKLVGSRLARPDAVDLLKAEIHDEAEAEAIRTQLAALYEDRRQVGVDRGKRLLDGEQAKIATDVINEDIAALERKQNDAEKMAVLDGIPLGKPEAREAVLELSPDRFRAVVARLLTATVMPVGKGNHTFAPERVVVAWR